jgi:hypothetical protein
MLLKIDKMTTWHRKQLLGDEYTRESLLPNSEYTGSQLLGVFGTSIRTGLPKKNFW